MNITEYVKFLGKNKDRNYIYQNLCGYNLLVQPSLYEGFGITIIEAMAAGIEVLVSDIDGPLEIIEKIGYGHKFKSGDAGNCASEICKIYYKYNATRVLGITLNRKEKVCEKLFNIEITTRNYLEEYRNLLQA